MKSDLSNFMQLNPYSKTREPDLVDLKGMELEELQSFCEKFGEPNYRGKQLFNWIYNVDEISFDRMMNLPTYFRENLMKVAKVGRFVNVEVQTSIDGTEKYSWVLADSSMIESVRIPMLHAGNIKRWSICISTQVGCAMGCEFCLTGKMGFVRQLTSGEIVEQFLAAKRRLGKDERFHNIVFMGMGEPLDNFHEMKKAAKILTDPNFEGISRKRLTVSTVGISNKIEEFLRTIPDVGLAISLHASDDFTRSKLVPVNRKWNLSSLLSICKNLPLKDIKRITFEYVLLKGVNDSEKDANQLVKILSGIRSKINLIPWNQFQGVDFESPDEKNVEKFQNILKKNGFMTTVRKRKGADISAACGQLADDSILKKINQKNGRSKI
ncbi:MAG: 23S rRNA (adenine(2503)-C(2))-methyltransferase RlmN [Nitrospinae bacterium]|nr:23S rRNA (adenine(2503)-C(2))-methyltransferase RlmN [Nitrospinota bacterium]